MSVPGGRPDPPRAWLELRFLARFGHCDAGGWEPSTASQADLVKAGDLNGYGVWNRVVKEVEQFQREEPASQLLPRDRAVALRRRNPEKTLASLLDGSMGSAFVFIAPLVVSCSTGSAPASLRRR